MGLISNRMKYLGLSRDTDIFLVLVLRFHSLSISRYPWEPSRFAQAPWPSLPASAAVCAPCCSALLQGTAHHLTTCFPRLWFSAPHHFLPSVEKSPPFHSPQQSESQMMVFNKAFGEASTWKVWEKPSNWTLHGTAPKSRAKFLSGVERKAGMPSVCLPIPPGMRAPACRPSPASKKEISLKTNAVCRAAPHPTPFSYRVGLLTPSSLERSSRMEHWLYFCRATGP